MAKLRCLFAALFCLVTALAWAQPGPSPGNITTPQATDFVPLYGRGTTGPLFGTVGGLPIGGVNVSGTPAVGYVPIATSPTTAVWTNLFGTPNVWTAPQTAAIQGSGGFGTLNPYTFIWPTGEVVPNYSPLINTQVYLPAGGISATKQLGFGNFDTASTVSFNMNSNRGGCINGYTADNQISAIQEVGAAALCSQSDSIPYLFAAAGTFTSTTFVATTNMTSVNVTYPFGTTSTATQQSLLQPNMWVVTNDAIPLYGRITSVGTGSGFTVGGWFALGNNAAGQTPAGNIVYVNPQNFFWVQQGNLFLNKLGKSVAGVFTAPTGTVTNASPTITSVSDTTGVMVGQLISATGIPAGSAVTAYTSNSITVNQNATSTPGSPVSLTISTHPGNAGLWNEPDIWNSGPAFSPLTPVKVTGCTATSGSNTLTGCSTIPATVRWGHIVYPSDSTKVPAADAVIAVPSSTSVVLNLAATGSGSVDLTFFSNFTKGGVGSHGACVLANQCNTNYSSTGAWGYSFGSHGAGDTAFMMRSDGLGPTPNYGFRYDHNITGINSGTCDFAVTGFSSNLWCITSGGTEFVQNAFISGALGIGATASALTLDVGSIGLSKEAASASAPGAGGGKIELVCGTNSGSAKLIAFAGTSSTPVAILDNIGSGVTGC